MMQNSAIVLKRAGVHRGPMPPRHRLLAIAVAAIWGINFLAIDASLAQFPPLFLVALRFALIAIPTVLLVRPPKVPLRWLLGYGLGFGVAQYSLLYIAMTLGMPAGLASLVLQASAPFTVLLGVLFTRESLGRRAGIGIGVAVLGLAVVGWHRAENASIWPFVLTLLAGLGWAIGNICTREARSTQPLRLVLWMSVIPPIPTLLLSLVVEGPQRIAASADGLLSTRGLVAILGLLYTMVIATLLASGIWSWLMSRHPAGAVAPFSMLVPVVGMSAAWIVLSQGVAPLELTGGVLVVGGVLLASWVPRRRAASDRDPRMPRPEPEPEEAGVASRP